MSTGRNCIASSIGILRDKFGPLLQGLPNNLRLPKSTDKASKTPNIIDVFQTVSCRASASLNSHCHSLYDRFLDTQHVVFLLQYLSLHLSLPPTYPPLPPRPRPLAAHFSQPHHPSLLTTTYSPSPYLLLPNHKEGNRNLQNFPVLSRGLQGMSGGLVCRVRSKECEWELGWGAMGRDGVGWRGMWRS